MRGVLQQGAGDIVQQLLSMCCSFKWPEFCLQNPWQIVHNYLLFHLQGICYPLLVSVAMCALTFSLCFSFSYIPPHTHTLQTTIWFCFIESGSHYVAWLSWNSLHITGDLELGDLPASVTWVQGLKTCITITSLLKELKETNLFSLRKLKISSYEKQL